MEIRAIGQDEAGGAVMAAWVSMAATTVAAPTHPLADRDGRVPVEVFNAPPEMMRAILASPVRGPSEAVAVGPDRAGSDGPTVSSVRPSHGSSVDIEM
ncbi:MAG: hypothetical protein ACXIVQ_10395 [Acidimicrobiales bacterium]